MMALRLARAFTGGSKIVRFRGHFHGWNDHMTSATRTASTGRRAPASWRPLAESVLLADPNDAERSGGCWRSTTVAAVILEPTGATFGQVPTGRPFLERCGR
jgi:glutamate-1-semialdehyde 2,1-aminomutase